MEGESGEQMGGESEKLLRLQKNTARDILAPLCSGLMPVSCNI